MNAAGVNAVGVNAAGANAAGLPAGCAAETPEKRTENPANPENPKHWYVSHVT